LNQKEYRTFVLYHICQAPAGLMKIELTTSCRTSFRSR
jgi:hypothetical protein